MKSSWPAVMAPGTPTVAHKLSAAFDLKLLSTCSLVWSVSMTAATWAVLDGSKYVAGFKSSTVAVGDAVVGFVLAGMTCRHALSSRKSEDTML